jgi:diketogulonate reductase-like aldo/keto reductase
VPLQPPEPAGVRIPPFLYGTAWKESETQRLTELALQSGFRGIDTANQRKHYHEAGVGQAVASSLQSGIVTREDLFLQTKFTFRPGQDDRLPYDPRAAIAIQVQQSFESSLTHLGVDFIDSYILHGPSERTGLAAADWEAWRAMESIHDNGHARCLGISNVTLEQLRLLHQSARVSPLFVQNRCYAIRQWDKDVRTFCAGNGMIYQGFSLLTANRALLARREMDEIAIRHNRSVSQIVFRFALEIGILPLTGTTSVEHMRDDLNVLDFRLKSDEITQIEQLAAI